MEPLSHTFGCGTNGSRATSPSGQFDSGPRQCLVILDNLPDTLLSKVAHPHLLRYFVEGKEFQRRIDTAHCHSFVRSLFRSQSLLNHLTKGCTAFIGCGKTNTTCNRATVQSLADLVGRFLFHFFGDFPTGQLLPSLSLQDVLQSFLDSELRSLTTYDTTKTEASQLR